MLQIKAIQAPLKPISRRSLSLRRSLSPTVSLLRRSLSPTLPLFPSFVCLSLSHKVAGSLKFKPSPCSGSLKFKPSQAQTLFSKVAGLSQVHSLKLRPSLVRHSSQAHTLQLSLLRRLSSSLSCSLISSAFLSLFKMAKETWTPEEVRYFFELYAEERRKGNRTTSMNKVGKQNIIDAFEKRFKKGFLEWSLLKNKYD
ncbi:hypothetical protein IGI04_024639, partial [Brassica rapa subsp. trilocularis]